jgi:uncharacterized protein (TIGR02246 family)
MHRTIVVTIALLSFGVVRSSGAKAQTKVAGDVVERQIIALERAAIDRYIVMDPQGYLSLYAPDVTYFDPSTERRLDGLKAMQEFLGPMKTAKNRVSDPRYEIIRPKVQRYGDVAVLTFNIINYGKPPDKPEQALARWNVTEVYRHVNGKWEIVHSHFSFVKPTLKPPDV